MLVLTRKINQQIRLNDDITITVLRAKGNSIRIGIDAPRSVRVVRGELEPLNESEPQAAALKLEEIAGEAPAQGKASESALPAADDSQVYQMRTTAPLSGFLRRPNTPAMASTTN